MNVKKDERNNIIYGAEYIPENSKVNFVGTGNILYLESGVYLENAILNFNGSDSIIYIRGGNHKLNLNVSVNAYGASQRPVLRSKTAEMRS